MTSKRKHVQDVRIENHGSIYVLQPLTETARAWIADNLPSDAMWWAGGLVVEPRYVADIVAGMSVDGLDVPASYLALTGGI